MVMRFTRMGENSEGVYGYNSLVIRAALPASFFHPIAEPVAKMVAQLLNGGVGSQIAQDKLLPARV